VNGNVWGGQPPPAQATQNNPAQVPSAQYVAADNAYNAAAAAQGQAPQPAPQQRPQPGRPDRPDRQQGGRRPMQGMDPTMRDPMALMRPTVRSFKSAPAGTQYKR